VEVTKRQALFALVRLAKASALLSTVENGNTVSRARMHVDEVLNRVEESLAKTLAKPHRKRSRS
jgi:hypothetical protein